MKTLKPYLQAKVMIPFFMQIALIIYVISALQLAPPMVDGLLSESSFPCIIFLIATPAALKLLFDGLKAVRKELASAGNAPVQPKKKSIKPVLVVVIMAVFMLLFETLGFSVLAPLYVFFFMLVYDDKPQDIGKKIIYSILIAAVVYVLYVVAFDIRFPEIWR
jgi:hypothetical protein